VALSPATSRASSPSPSAADAPAGSPSTPLALTARHGRGDPRVGVERQVRAVLFQ
jgi:hypothetical protein